MRCAVPAACACAALLFAAGAMDARADDAPGGGRDANLPVVLLVPERTQASTPQLADLTVRMKIALHEAMANSGRFQVHTFVAGESVIKRALNEHLIAADDLAEPHKTESLERIARAIGARFILKFGTTLDKSEARTAMTYMDQPNPASWLVLADDSVAVPLVLGRKRLKPDDIVNLTVDSITARMGIPTHLAGNLQILPGSRAIAEADRKAKQAAESRAAKNAAIGLPVPPPRGTDPGSADNTAAPPTRGDVGRASSRAVKPPRDAGTTKAGSTTRGASGARAQVPGPPVFANEADPSRDVLPTLPAVAPPPVIAHPDYEAQANRYRQTGDLSNAVLALRHAVNERPRDISLRRQLILAYQTRQMPEAAHAEALRALRLDPNSANLYRLYGEVLMAEGDLDGAMQAFREGIRVDAADIGCQVALGDALLAGNHYLPALEAYNAASKSDGKSPLPHRRIARALAVRAGTDPDQYGASLAEVRRARELTPAADTDSYVEDYIAIMHVVDARIREMLEELQAANQARVQVKKTPTELQRQIADMKQRTAALADYLDKLPPAVGHEITQAHYVQANALLVQALGFFKDLVEKGDDRFAEAMKSGQVQAQRELTNAGQRLTGTKAGDKAHE
jgi:tetratricopeptide (TPR) repeat protein